ncbi:hypothetical protein RND81_14G212100 [Saponaria officinalis]|uniref:Glycosyltransferase n=1 Tax=Saponaria officinalis TaxID=3572 RepID=A0AAW1GQL4_SAPOF
MDDFSNDTKKVSMFFFPFMAAGHLLPMIGIARAIASHSGVQVTIIATPKNVGLFQEAIDRDRENGHDIGFLTIELPNKDELDEVENFLVHIPLGLKLKVFMAVMNLKDTLKDILVEYRPDCLVSDPMHPWSLGVAEEVGVPRIVFHSSSLFWLCCEHVLWTSKPHEGLNSETEPFVLDGLPDRVEFTKKMLPHWHRQQKGFTAFFHEKQKADDNSYGGITNSSRELEYDYVDYSKNVMGKKVWMVGPVRNQQINTHSQGGEHILKWLDSKEPRSVLYVSFGTEAFLARDQFHEIARGLKASGHPFIWVARTETYTSEGDEDWFPKGFEEEIRGSNQGLVIKGWAPQVMILGHPNVGAFMTHCGWNSCLESLTNGVPVITWPITADQFFNESLLVDVAKVGFRVGNKEQMSMDVELKATVTRDQIEEVTRRVIAGGKEVKKIRARVKKYAEESKKAVQQGGSSYQDTDTLFQELKTRKTGL